MVLPYWRILVGGFRTQTTYRAAMLGGLVANATFGFLKAAVLLATVRAAGGEVAGYDAGAMSAYVWLSQGLLGAVNFFGGSDFAERVRTGDVAVDFARPISPQLAAMAHEIGKSAATLLPRGVPSVLIGALVVGMTMPTTPLPYVLGMLSLALGMTVSAAVVQLLATAGLWLVETRGLQVLYMVVSGFFAGLFVPISLFPGWLRTIAEATPFPSMMMYPIDILSARVDFAGSARLFATQVVWLVAVVGLGACATHAGRRRLEVQGG
jgi:ABC-2 type transport system permease protein